MDRRTVRRASERAAGRVGRVKGGALLVGAVVAVTLADAVPLTKPAVDWFARYSPDRLFHGAVWTLPASVLLVGHPTMLGMTSVMAVLVFLPFCLTAGVRTTVIVGMAGHVASTLLVAALLAPAALLGSHEALRVARMGDYGASAFLAALAGGGVILLWSRVRPLAVVLGAGLLLFFGASLVGHSGLMHNVADVEHLTAIGVGASLTWHRCAARSQTETFASAPIAAT